MEESLIKKYRKRAGYTQKEVSEALNVTQGAVSSWEAGRWEPDQQNLKALADLFGVSVDALLGRDEGKIAPQWQTVQQKEDDELSRDTVMIPAVGRVRAGWDGIAEQDISSQNRTGELYHWNPTRH